MQHHRLTDRTGISEEKQRLEIVISGNDEDKALCSIGPTKTYKYKDDYSDSLIYAGNGLLKGNMPNLPPITRRFGKYTEHYFKFCW